MTPEAILATERGVLAACLESPDLMAEVRPLLRVEDLTLGLHRGLWAAALELDAAGRRCDVLTLAGHLGQAALDALGGVSALATLVDTTPSAVDVVDLASVLAAQAIARRVRERCTVAAAASEWDDPTGWVSELEGDLYALTERRQGPGTATMGECLETVMASLAEGGVRPVPTGLAGLDAQIGGWRPGTVSVVAARPGMGKTAFGLGIALHAASVGYPVAFISLEMTIEQLTIRAMSQLSGVSATAIERGDLSGWHSQNLARAAKARELLPRIPLAVDPTPGLSVSGVRSAVRRCLSRLKRRGVTEPLGLVVVDYLQIMGTDGRVNSREEAVARNSAGLIALAKEMGVPVLALAQLNRESEKRTDGRPKLSDIRESGAIEQDAYTVIGLWRDVSAPDSAEAIVLKCRQGGQTGTVPLHWDGPTMSYTDRGLGPDVRDLDTPPEWL